MATKAKARSENSENSISQEADSNGMQQNEGNDTMQSVDRLQEFGINAGDITKLKTAGIFTFVFKKEHC